MARTITATGTEDFQVKAGRTAFLQITGTWDSASIAVQTKNGAGSWVTYPTNGTLTADSAYYYQLGDEDGFRVSATVTGTTSLQAQVVELNNPR